LILFYSTAEDRRGFTEEELAYAIDTRGEVTQILENAVIDVLRTSLDGEWITYARYSWENPDIKNNEIWMLASDGSRKRKIDSPYGFKSTPVLFGGDYEHGVKKPLLLFVSVVEHDGNPAGIYVAEINGEKPEWKLWEEGEFRNLSFSLSGDYLMASTGNWHSRKIRSNVIVWPVDEDGRKSGRSYIVAPKLKGQVKKIAMTPDKTDIIFACRVDHPDSYYGISNIYIAENRERAPVELLFEDASTPSVRESLYGYTLYYKNGSESVRRYNPLGQTTKDVVYINGITPNGMDIDPRKNRIFLGVQTGAYISGLLAIENP
jgi:hypothetical protein